MADVVNLLGPEPGWESAVSGYVRRNNTVRQVSLWERADGFGHVAVLRVHFADVILRLRLTVEESWEDLGPVEVATFDYEGITYAVSRMMSDIDITEVHLKSVDGDGARREAVARLLTLLGTDWGTVVYWRVPNGSYESMPGDGGAVDG